MALQGDGNGIVTIPSAVATGDFSLIFSDLEMTNPANAEIILGIFSANNNFVATFNGPLLYSRLSGTNANGQYSGITGEHVKYEISRVGTLLNQYVDDVLIGTINNSNTFSLDTFFTYNNGAFKYTGLLTGTCDMVGFTGAGARSYDFEGSGTTLIDTISGENGTLSGFTTGGFTAPSTGITITSVSDHQCLQRDASNQAVFTIAGAITGGTATTVEYQLDSGTWQVLDDSPTATYTGTVTVTNGQSVSVRWSNDTGVTATVAKLKAAACIVIAPAQSNAVSRIINAQTLTVDSGKPTPAMYKAGVFSALADPTGVDWDGSNDGSLWPYIVKQYSDLGIPVCIGNVAEGGTSILSWAKGGALYDRVEQFGTACGGVEFAIALIGETDSSAGTSTSVFKTRYVDVCTDINTDYGCDTYAVYFPVGSGTGTTINVDAVRLGITESIDENSFIKFGGDLSVIDISSATNALNDNLHIKLDADATTASQIIYSALTASTSIITITGIPDGTFLTTLITADRPSSLIESVDRVYSGGSSTFSVNVPVGTQMYGVVRDNLDPSTDGAAINAVTV